MSQFYVAQTSGAVIPPDVATSYVTDAGTAVPALNILNVNAGNSTQECGSSVRFTGVTNTVELHVTDALGNTCIGKDCVANASSAASNTALGNGALFSIGFSSFNVAIGSSSLSTLDSAFFNTVIGCNAGQNLVGGDYNTLIGFDAGFLYTGSERGNVIVGPTQGVTGEINTTRIGSNGVLSTKTASAYIYGVFGSTVSASTAQVVLADTTGLLGSIANGTTGQVLTATTGSAPTWQAPTTPSAVYTQVNFAMSPYTVTGSDYFISVDSTGGAVTINLPDSPTANRQFIVKDRLGTSNANNITVKSLTGASTIDGQASYIFNDNYEALECLFNGANYEIF